MAGTTPFTLTADAYQDLGPAPAQIQVFNGQARFQVSDTQPMDLKAPGWALSSGFPLKIEANDASSHVWGLALGGPSGIAVGNVYSAGGSGGTTDVNIAKLGGAAVSGTLPVNTPVSKIVTQAPTVTASAAYASGNCIGGLLTFAGVVRGNNITGILQQAGVFCKSAQTGAVDLVLFSANPTASTLTDKTNLAIAAADFDKVIGVAHITDWTSLGTPSFAQALGLAMPFAPASGGTTIYGVLVARSTPTFASTSDVEVYVKALDD